jgi:hypothetical protein
MRAVRRWEKNLQKEKKMATSTPTKAEVTTFSIDVLGRYTCNGLDEAKRSADTGAKRPDGSSQADARPFTVIVLGGGSFGSALAQHLLYADKSHSHRILVLDAGRLALPEHVQNLPMVGLNVPVPITTDPGTLRNEVWGLPWRTEPPLGFPGLAYCLGGRSIFFGGWSPQLLDAEMPPASWPNAVVLELRDPLPDGSSSYFRQASEQIGTTESNDFIFGEMHIALRQQLFDGITSGKLTEAVPLAEMPLHLDGVPAGEQDIAKLEAPLAVQGRPPRSGFFPINKFSSVPLLMEAARSAQSEAGNDDVKKRLMVVPNCHITRLITSVKNGKTVVSGVETDQGPLSVPENGVVVIALGTIESARLALVSFGSTPNANLIGQNLIAHLRSNLTIRIPRGALSTLSPAIKELQASALFVKGRHTRTDGSVGHFHVQITAAGLDRPGTDSEAELFKKIPDIDMLAPFLRANDDSVVVTVRGIGEMMSQNPDSHVTLASGPGGLDEFNMPRALVKLTASAGDTEVWEAMDKAADEVAKVFANNQPYEVLSAGAFKSVAAGQAASAVVPFAQRRDGLGTTHHEAGTLWMGVAPGSSVTNPDARFHGVANAYVAGPALFPTGGSPNPMLTAIALGRRLGDHLAHNSAPLIPTPSPGFTLLFDGINTSKWSMSKISNQPGRDNPGRFLVVNGTLEAVPGSDIGLFWHTEPTPPDFILKLEWLRWQENDNSGVFVRFPNPNSKGYDNTAYVGVDFGFEVQIDQTAAPDGAPVHMTGAIYGLAGPQNPGALPIQAVGEWNEYEIKVKGQSYTATLNGQQVTSFTFTVGSDPLHPERGLPSTSLVPRYIGLQAHTGRVAFRNIQIKAI